VLSTSKTACEQSVAPEPAGETELLRLPGLVSSLLVDADGLCGQLTRGGDVLGGARSRFGNEPTLEACEAKSSRAGLAGLTDGLDGVAGVDI
jgi:hypothetical protein